MIVGLCADPHGNVEGLRAVLGHFAKSGAETVFCAGDLVGYYPFVNETISLLRETGAQCVMGNHDAILAGQLDVSDDRRRAYRLDDAARVISASNLTWLRRLPLQIATTCDGVRVVVVHGSPWAPLSEYVYPDSDHFERFATIDADLVVLGHTHHRLHKQVGRTQVVNPGSCGQARDTRGLAVCAILDTASRAVEFATLSYNCSALVSSLNERGDGELARALLPRGPG